jgi:PPOX class probable F420-dependent enzyme
MTTTHVPDVLRSLAASHDMLLETRKRDGTWVPTPVNPYVDGDRVLFRTWSTSGKAKRLRNFAEVRIAPCTRSGRRTGEQLVGQAHRLEGHEAAGAASLMNRRYPLLQGVAVRLYHRLRRFTTEHYEITALR